MEVEVESVVNECETETESPFPVRVPTVRWVHALRTAVLSSRLQHLTPKVMGVTKRDELATTNAVLASTVGDFMCCGACGEGRRPNYSTSAIQQFVVTTA